VAVNSWLRKQLERAGWVIAADGSSTRAAHQLFSPDNTYDIGASGATRPANIWAAGNIQAGPSGLINWRTRSVMSSSASGVIMLSDSAQTDFSRLQFGGTTSSFPALKRSTAGLEVRLADDSASTYLTGSELFSANSTLTVGSGTGVTVNANGGLRRQVYKVTITSAAFTAAALTSDVTIATLPAKTAVLGVYTDTTVAFAGLAGTISLSVGTGATPTNLIAAHDVKTAAVTKGLADADLGTDLARATAVQGGKVYSFTATTSVLARITSGTGNVGTGSASNMSAGSVTIYIITERLP
jgi:hypothetical protein